MNIDLKQKIGEIKAFTEKLDKRTKIISAVVALIILIVAVTVAFVLNNKSYTPILIDGAEDDATQIVSYLQSQGVDYQYKGGGNVLVEESQADKIRAELAYEGYLTSGFNYEVYIDNAGGMTTDTEKATYELYDLQNRLSSTIELFDGVKDAKVTIALADEQKYVLQSDAQNNSSKASVVVTMQNGAELEAKQAQAIQSLVSSNVTNMTPDNVTVFDQNGIELSATASDGATNTTEVQLAEIVEQKIEQKVANILSPFFGNGNIRVSANGKINMEKVIRETTTYTTPDKIDANDKTGIISSEQGSDSTGSGTQNATGVAGTETNSDTTEYNQDGAETNDTYNSSTYSRDYLVNSVKEQTEIDPGIMDDLTISISINSENYGSLNQEQVVELAANATGITLEDATQKITVVAAPFYDDATNGTQAQQQALGFIEQYLMYAILIAGFLFIIFVILFILFRMRRKSKLKKQQLLQTIGQPVQQTDQKEDSPDIDIINMKNEKSMELRENIRDFVNMNPEISAQMIRSWINGGEQDGGN